MAKSRVDETWDPLGGRLPPEAEAYRRAREADNVVGSYFNASDLLAEALQNAADAIDARSEEAEERSPRIIEVDFDAYDRRFSVSDSGTGMSRTALDIVFQPNVTLKAGPLARPTKRSKRGEKGVGLSFLLFSCDSLEIRTCDGRHRYDASIRGASSWAHDPDSSPHIEYELLVSDADTHLGSDRYTVVTLSSIDAERFDTDLFDMPADQVEWTLRTRTAVGNTAYLFNGLDFEQPEDIEVTLRYRSSNDENENDVRSVPYRYATPEDILALAEELGITDPVTVYDFDDDFEMLAALRVAELRETLRGAALRYVAGYESSSGKDVAVYMFAMAGDEMGEILDGLRDHDEVGWVPSEWQGFWVATRDMPTGVPLRGGVLPTRGYEQRTFGLLQLDDLKLDVGRKSLHGQTARMFRDILREAWNDDLRWIVERIPRARHGKGAGTLEIERRVREAQRLADIDAGIPFSKVPLHESDVAAVFHEMLGSGTSLLPQVHGLTTRIFSPSDLIASNGGSSNGDAGDAPLHIVFGFDQRAVLETFDANRNVASTADLAVVWTLATSPTEDDEVSRIEIEAIKSGTDNYHATHWLNFGGLGGREEPLRIVVLSKVIESVDQA